jgi:hypothetical protein
LNDQFVLDRNFSTITATGVTAPTSGQQNAYRNTLTPQLRWQATQTTGINFFLSYTLIRFQNTAGGGTSGVDSDTYRAGVSVDRQLTRRLTGTAGLEVGYLDVRNEAPAASYTGTLGFGYDVTPTLRASVSAGPSVLERRGDTTVSPAVTATLTQLFKFGSAQLGYSRAFGAATVGVSDQQTIFASLAAPTLYRRLQFEVIPRYSIVDVNPGSDHRGSSETVRTLLLDLRATYQLVRNISLTGSYTFFKQTGTPSSSVTEIDQNRVFFGIRYAYPINFY